MFPDTDRLQKPSDFLQLSPWLVCGYSAFDHAVERCYRPERASYERDNLEFLFILDEKLANPLTANIPNRARNK